MCACVSYCILCLLFIKYHSEIVFDLFIFLITFFVNIFKIKREKIEKEWEPKWHIAFFGLFVVQLSHIIGMIDGKRLMPNAQIKVCIFLLFQFHRHFPRNCLCLSNSHTHKCMHARTYSQFVMSVDEMENKTPHEL